MPGQDYETLPDLYARWALDLLGEGIPREARATCATCAMCAPPGVQPARSANFFDPKAKCCTYWPSLPNFLAGRVLEAGGAGAETLAGRIKAHSGVTPLGVDSPPGFSAIYSNADNAFGQAKALLCPHFVEDGGLCAIWNNRNSVCATWFCKFVRGETGWRFWNALQRTLDTVERQLAKWCIGEIGLGEETMRRLMNAPAWRDSPEPLSARALDGGDDADLRGRLWGDWHGREVDFFRRCAALVEALSWPDILGLCGQDARALAGLTQANFRRLRSDDIPGNLVPGRPTLIDANPDRLRLSTYHVHDPVDIPPALFSALAYFDGGDTARTLAAIESELGVALAPDLVRKLVDFGLLEPAEDGARLDSSEGSK